MKNRRPSSHVYAPNFQPEPISNDDLIRGFLLALGGSGRRERTLEIYGQSLKMLSDFVRSNGLPCLVEMQAEHVRFWLKSLYDRGNKHSSVSVRYRAVNRFFNWCVQEGEREDNPLDKVDPPHIPDELQPFYRPEEVETVLKAIGHEGQKGNKIYQLRDDGVIRTLYDTGVRAAELCGMQVEGLDWKRRTIIVTGKAGKQRHVSFGFQTGQSIERYLRRRGFKSIWLWLASGQKPFTTNGLRMMLERRFQSAGVKFRGIHAFRRGFAMSFLAAGGQEGDLKELGGWESFAMVTRYARGNAAERAIDAHKKFSPGDHLRTH